MAADHAAGPTQAVDVTNRAAGAVQVVAAQAKAAANLAEEKAGAKADNQVYAVDVAVIGDKRRRTMMADQNPNRIQPEKLEHGETQPARDDIKEQRGGPQDNQLTGQVEKGAHNQEAKGRNPQGNEPERWSR